MRFVAKSSASDKLIVTPLNNERKLPSERNDSADTPLHSRITRFPAPRTGKAISLASSSKCSPNAVQKLGKSPQCPFYSSVQRTSGSDLWRVQISFRSLPVLLSAKSSHRLGVKDSGSENLA